MFEIIVQEADFMVKLLAVPAGTPQAGQTGLSVGSGSANQEAPFPEL